jgi:hypothetical protein
MEMMEKIELLNGVEEKGCFGFVAITKLEALKKSRTTKEPTPANLTVITKTLQATVSLGNDYTNAVNNRLDAEGKATEFQAKSTYCHPVAQNKLVYKHNEKESYYLRVYPNLCHSFVTNVRYEDVNGVEIPVEEFKKLQAEYFKLPSTNSNQGLDNAIIVLNYGLEGVKMVKRGDVKLLDLAKVA